MRFEPGENYSSQILNRLSNSIPYGYIVYLEDSDPNTDAMAEANFPNGTDYGPGNVYTQTDNAITALHNLGGGTVFITNDDYRVATADDITMKNNVEVVGESEEGTILGSTTNYFITRFNAVSHSGIHNLTVYNSLVGAYPSIYMYGSSPNNINVKNIHFKGTTNYAMSISPSSGYADIINVQDCLCDSANIGYFCYGGNIRQSHFQRNTVQDCSSVAFYIKGLTDSDITNNTLIDAVENEFNAAITISNTTASQNSSICGNKIRFTANPPNTVNGILISGEGSDSLYNEVLSVEANTCVVEAAVTSNVNTFIYCHGKDATHHTVRNVSFASNVMQGLGKINYGMVLYTTDHIIAQGNIFDTMEKNGILIDDADYVKLLGNKVRNYDQEADSNTAIGINASPANLVGDGVKQSYIPADLSGGAATHYLMSPEQNVCLLNAYLKYTEAASADAGVTLILGKESDDDYYYTGTSNNGAAEGQVQWWTDTLTLLKRDLAAGDTLIFNSAGGKAGTGEIICVVDYCFID